MIDYVNGKMQDSNADFKISECNALDAQKVAEVIHKKVQFVLMHPPYMDIVKLKGIIINILRVIVVNLAVAEFGGIVL